MKAIQQWFASKGGVAHVIASSFVFLIAAYALDPQFHAYVLKINSMLPAWTEESFTVGIGLWAFYKNWQKTAK